MLNISLSISDCEVMSICSNATHRLKRATDLRDCVSALCLQREKHESTCMRSSASYVHDGLMFSFCFLLIVWKELPFCLSQIHYSELHRAGTSGAVSGSRECFYVPKCAARLQGLIAYSP